MMDKHRAYFERRLFVERAAAAQARDPLVKLAHLEFVQLYEMRLSPTFSSTLVDESSDGRAMLTPMPSPTRESLSSLFDRV